MPPTNQPNNKLSVVAQWAFDYVDSRRRSLGINKVYYGDRQALGRTPVVCIEPGYLESELAGAQFAVENTFTVYLLVYHSKVENESDRRKEVDELAESIMDALHEDHKGGGLFVWSMVTSIESGYTVRDNSLLQSARMTWMAMTKGII